MTPIDIPAIRALAERIRSESNLADRPGQMARLESIAIELDALAALAALAVPVAEVEWEYGLLNPQGGFGGVNTEAHLVSGNREHIEKQHRRGHPAILFVRRRKAGPWEPVEAGDPHE